MKRRTAFAGIGAALVIALYVYFAPLSVPGQVGEPTAVVWSEMGIRDGKPYEDMDAAEELTEEQKEALSALLGQMKYRRTWNTLFSRGEMEGTGDRMLTLSMNGGAGRPGSIIVFSSGEIMVSDRSYRMRDAEAFIRQARQIVKKDGTE